MRVERFGTPGSKHHLYKIKRTKRIFSILTLISMKTQVLLKIRLLTNHYTETVNIGNKLLLMLSSLRTKLIFEIFHSISKSFKLLF